MAKKKAVKRKRKALAKKLPYLTPLTRYLTPLTRPAVVPPAVIVPPDKWLHSIWSPDNE
ncbi:hypothetical protein [Acidocella sp.]|jgi:hypothetical protein|uniref:hypothetical protein n=1 Tax=Acidocella sp. TaxID=50710 RepID=UPI002F41E4F4